MGRGDEVADFFAAGGKKFLLLLLDVIFIIEVLNKPHSEHGNRSI